jgi:rhodanese-related sulfurtransferase
VTAPIEIDVQSVKSLLQSGSDFVLIDCREQDEWNTAKIEGAVLIPMSQWMESTGKLKEFVGKRLAVHCHHGGRSLRVTHWLRQNGFPEAQNMSGGIDAWSQLIDSSVPRY